MTPFHRAVSRGHIQVTEYMIPRVANSNIRENNGRTPLFLAELWGHDSIADLLQQIGAGY
jgi:ankyrin repeat protein